MGPARLLARDPRRASDRRVAVRDPRTDRRTTLGSVGRAKTVASHGSSSRREVAVRATPTATRPRGRDGARRCPVGRDPAATRTRAPRHHEHLPAGHRHQRDHRHRSRTAVSDDLRQRRSPDEAIDRSATGSARRSPGRPDATPQAGDEQGRRDAPVQARIRAHSGMEAAHGFWDRVAELGQVPRRGGAARVAQQPID